MWSKTNFGKCSLPLNAPGPSCWKAIFVFKLNVELNQDCSFSKADCLGVIYSPCEALGYQKSKESCVMSSLKPSSPEGYEQRSELNKSFKWRRDAPWKIWRCTKEHILLFQALLDSPIPLLLRLTSRAGSWWDLLTSMRNACGRGVWCYAFPPREAEEYQ